MHILRHLAARATNNDRNNIDLYGFAVNKPSRIQAQSATAVVGSDGLSMDMRGFAAQIRFRITSCGPVVVKEMFTNCGLHFLGCPWCISRLMHTWTQNLNPT